jgi:hypothetical protein
MTEAPDFIQADEPPEDLAAQIRERATELVGLMATAERKKEELEELNARIYELSAKTLPEKMMEARMDICGLPELGFNIKLKDWVRALLPRPGEDGSTVDRDKATAWLVDHGASALIKAEVKVAFDRSEHNVAVSAAEDLRQRYPDKRVEVKEDIHHMSYTAWAREQLKAGEAMPLEMLGISIGKVAEVVKRKEEK